MAEPTTIPRSEHKLSRRHIDNDALKVISRLQQFLLSVPVIRPIYSATKKLVESFSGSPVTGFKRVVAIEYPRPGLWTIGPRHHPADVVVIDFDHITGLPTRTHSSQ